MFGGLNRTLAAAAIVGGAVLVVAPPVLADGCGGGPSAQNVYTECLGSGGGGKSASHSGGGKPASHSGGGSNSTGGGANTAGSSSTSAISPQAKKALAKAGQDGKSLKQLANEYGARRLLQSSSSGPETEPSAVGSAFDVGSGPTALLIVLGCTAVLLLAASGFSVVRQRRH